VVELPSRFDDWNILENWLGLQPGQELTVEAQEKFSRGFEAYLQEGKLHLNSCKRVFYSLKMVV